MTSKLILPFPEAYPLELFVSVSILKKSNYKEHVLLDLFPFNAGFYNYFKIYVSQSQGPRLIM